MTKICRWFVVIGSLLVGSIAADIDSVPVDDGLAGNCQYVSDNWQECLVSTDDKTYTIHRTITKISRPIAQTFPYDPMYTLELEVDTEMMNPETCNNRIVYIPELPEDLLYHMMDIAKLAWAADAYVVVAVDRSAFKENINDCKRPRVLSISVMSR